MERVEAWARKLSFPGGSAERAFAELYTDAPECVVVLAGVEVSAAGGSDKESWARAEIEVAAQFARRSMQFDGIYPSGDTVAVEARRIAETLDGRHLEWPFAAFLTFDGAGQIIRDHTYRTPPGADESSVAARFGSKVRPSARDRGTAGGLPVVHDLALTGTERRNLETVEAYCTAWSLPDGSVENGVDEVYGDTLEVSLILQGMTVASPSSKEKWRRRQSEIAARLQRRAVLMHAVYPSADLIAAEGRMDMETADGRRLGWPFALFLTFDGGRIVIDHTYLLSNENMALHEQV